MKIKYILIILVFLISCQNKTENEKIFVSILPQKHFVEKIAGNRFEVGVMVSPGMSPANYEPLPKQMLELSDANLFFRIGVSFEESWISKIKDINDKLKIVDTRKGIELRETDKFLHIESNHHEHGHSHGNFDPHIWLSPTLVIKQVENITDALVNEYPNDKNEFERNSQLFIKELKSLKNKIELILSEVGSKEFMVFHPSWGYFADEFGLQQIPVEIEGKEPNPNELNKIISFAKEKGIKRIFAQKQFSSIVLEAISKELDGEVISIDPLAENYAENLKLIAKKIAGKNNE